MARSLLAFALCAALLAVAAAGDNATALVSEGVEGAVQAVVQGVGNAIIFPTNVFEALLALAQEAEEAKLTAEDALQEGIFGALQAPLQAKKQVLQTVTGAGAGNQASGSS